MSKKKIPKELREKAMGFGRNCKCKDPKARVILVCMRKIMVRASAFIL